MTVVYSREFRHRYAALPGAAQAMAKKQEVLFRKNWRDPRLHTKKLLGKQLIFSFRITRRYRVLFMFVGESTALFLTIGHRSSIYR